MTRNSIFITTISILVVFFLTFLGMRLSFLENSSKPKPRPRAVITHVVKTASSTDCFKKHDFTPDLLIFHESPENHIPAFVLSRLSLKYFSKRILSI